MHPFEEFENAVLEALQPLIGDGVRTLAAYYDDVADVKDIANLTARFPAVYVAASELEVQPRNMIDEYRLTGAIIVGDKNVRGGEAAVRGDAASPGIYRLMCRVRELLHQKEIMDGWVPLNLSGEAVIETDPANHLYLYGLAVETRTPRYRNQ